jgi:hypothetical protein
MKKVKKVKKIKRADLKKIKGGRYIKATGDPDRDAKRT